MEESNQLGVLVISGGHGSAHEEYAMRRRNCYTELAIRSRIISPVMSEDMI